MQRLLALGILMLLFGTTVGAAEVVGGRSLTFSTFVGGASSDGAASVAVDAEGNVYVAGFTTDNEFPGAHHVGAISCCLNAFVAKYTPDGAREWAILFGGSQGALVGGAATAPDGDVIVVGSTSSQDFPAVTRFGAGAAGVTWDAFVVKVRADGSGFAHAALLGSGTGDDTATGVAVDDAGAVYVTGATNALDFPTRHALQPANRGGTDAFVTKIAPGWQALDYSTYLGSGAGAASAVNPWTILPIGVGSPDRCWSGLDAARAIAVDDVGSAYVTGFTCPLTAVSGAMPIAFSNFPLRNPAQDSARGSDEAFVTKLSPDGTALEYSTFLGGSSTERGNAIAVDAEGHAYVSGFTWSVDFPTAQAFQPRSAQESDAFVTRLSPTGDRFTHSTYLGGSGGETVKSMALASGRGVYVAGFTTSPDFPLKDPLQTYNPGGVKRYNDAFITLLTPSDLEWSTYLGGGDNDGIGGMDVGPSGEVVAAGFTMSSNFPIANATQGTLSGTIDAFLTRIGT